RTGRGAGRRRLSAAADPGRDTHLARVEPAPRADRTPRPIGPARDRRTGPRPACVLPDRQLADPRLRPVLLHSRGHPRAETIAQAAVAAGAPVHHAPAGRLV